MSAAGRAAVKKVDRHIGAVVSLHTEATDLIAKTIAVTQMRNAEVVWLVEHDGLSQTAVAGILGVSKQRINAMMKAAVRDKGKS